MKRTPPRFELVALVAPCLLLALAGCSDGLVEPGPNVDAPVLAWVDDDGESEVDVLALPGAATVIGEAEQVRTKRRIRVELEVEEGGSPVFFDGAAVTLWAVIFNDPSGCASSPCTAADFDLSPGSPSQTGFTQAGATVQDDDELEITGSLMEGAGSSVFPGARGLTDAEGAEIHYIVQSHGAYDPVNFPGQLDGPGLGCNPDCVDAALAIFLPGGGDDDD